MAGIVGETRQEAKTDFRREAREEEGLTDDEADPEARQIPHAENAIGSQCRCEVCVDELRVRIGRRPRRDGLQQRRPDPPAATRLGRRNRRGGIL